MTALTKRQQFLLWIVAAVVTTAGLVAILSAEFRHPAPRHALYVVGVPEHGATLFFGSKHCSICHSVNGEGGRRALDLGRIRPTAPAMGWLAMALWNHAPGMARQMRGAKSPQLNQQEMAHILAFLYQASTADRPGDRTAGKAVFEAKGCSRCHSVGSVGAAGGPDLARVDASGDPAAWMRAMWNHAQSMIGPITGQLGQWPQFHGNEMNDLIAYASSTSKMPGKKSNPGNAGKGWTTFQAKCIGCHSVHGGGGHIGPELGPDHELPNSPAEFAMVLWNHAPSMLARAREAGVESPTLQGDEIADIQQFLVSLRYFEPTGSPLLGERIFAERGCALCHGPSAQGSREGPRLRTEGEAFTTVSLATAFWSHGAAMGTRRTTGHHLAHAEGHRYRRSHQLPQRSAQVAIELGAQAVVRQGSRDRNQDCHARHAPAVDGFGALVLQNRGGDIEVFEFGGRPRLVDRALRLSPICAIQSAAPSTPPAARPSPASLPSAA
jgi:cytochrome c2